MYIIYRIEQVLQDKSHIGIFILRLFLGLRLIYGVIDNIVSWDKMIEFSQFLTTYHFPIPIVSAVISVYIQFVGAIFILLGYKIRIISIFLVFNFLIALVLVHIPGKDTIEGMTPALAMLFGCLTFVFTGADNIALDKYKN